VTCSVISGGARRPASVSLCGAVQCAGQSRGADDPGLPPARPAFSRALRPRLVPKILVPVTLNI
jgi:hypothetical protein